MIKELTCGPLAVIDTEALTGAFTKIIAERTRQNAMINSGKIPHNCASNDVHPGIKISVLAEEFGEVAKAINDESSTDELRTELIQVCAVALAIYEGTFE